MKEIESGLASTQGQVQTVMNAHLDLLSNARTVIILVYDPPIMVYDPPIMAYGPASR